MTDIPTLLVATGNPGKLREYEVLLCDAPFRLVSLRDVGITEEVEETGETFAENAWLKASGYAAMSGLLTLADDSGLEVDALGGDPGVRSARYGPALDEDGACRTDEDRVALLLRNLEGVPWPRRTARFRCVINVVKPSQTSRDRSETTSETTRPHPEPVEGAKLLASVVGSVAGMIQYAPEGDDGFGYDPVVYLPSFDRTVAQLSLEEKNRISHRGCAAARALTRLLPKPQSI
jgi:XTP/dITP diphosphohydrolase